MKWTKTLIPTQKETPADAQIISHQLMIRAGLIRQLTAGIYDFLPLGLRAIQKASAIVREEINRIGSTEVLLPAVTPIELWQKSGRDKKYGDGIFRLKDRHGRMMVLAPTHEEVVTELVGAYVNSYKQLPLTLYQIQTKERDEERPRFGLLRVREFLMMDAYSFNADEKSLDQSYQDMYQAYTRIFTRCGIPFAVVEADPGPIGGDFSHEFTAPCEAGEDIILTSDKGNYSANVEKAQIGTRTHTFSAEPTGALEKVHTPNLPGIEDVGKFMKVKPKNMLKTLVFKVRGSKPANERPENLAHPSWVVAVVRGDHDVNEPKVKKTAKEFFHVEQMEMVDDPEVRKEWAIGFCGPDKAVQRLDTVVLVDHDAAQGGFWATGANETDYHVKHFNWFRECGEKLADPKKVAVADIRNAAAGDPSPKNDGGLLKASRGIEIGHVFKLGTVFSEAFDAKILDAQGQSHPIMMGCYGIGIGRILIAVIESMHDDKGIIWPPAIAPYSVVITPIKYEGEVKEAADKLYAEFNVAGIDTILDDRDARPGFKFADADLIGFPVRINVGDRGLKEGKVEVKARKAAEADMVPLAGVLENVLREARDVDILYALSDAPPPILSYAPRNYAAGDAETPQQPYFVFERPDARKEFFTRCAGLFAVAVGFVVVVVMTYARYRSARGLEPIVGLACALGIFAMIITSCACLWGLLRTWRFRDTPVTIRVADGHIIVSDPVGLGPLPRVLPLVNVRRCVASYEALTGGAFRSYRIIFRMRSLRRRRVSVQVAVAEKGIVERAAADLQRAIDACAAREP